MLDFVWTLDLARARGRFCRRTQRSGNRGESRARRLVFAVLPARAAAQSDPAPSRMLCESGPLGQKEEGERRAARPVAERSPRGVPCAVPRQPSGRPGHGQIRRRRRARRTRGGVGPPHRRPHPRQASRFLAAIGRVADERLPLGAGERPLARLLLLRDRPELRAGGGKARARAYLRPGGRRAAVRHTRRPRSRRRVPRFRRRRPQEAAWLPRSNARPPHPRVRIGALASAARGSGARTRRTDVGRGGPASGPVRRRDDGARRACRGRRRPRPARPRPSRRSGDRDLAGLGGERPRAAPAAAMGLGHRRGHPQRAAVGARFARGAGRRRGLRRHHGRPRLRGAGLQGRRRFASRRRRRPGSARARQPNGRSAAAASRGAEDRRGRRRPRRGRSRRRRSGPPAQPEGGRAARQRERATLRPPGGRGGGHSAGRARSAPFAGNSLFRDGRGHEVAFDAPRTARRPRAPRGSRGADRNRPPVARGARRGRAPLARSPRP